MEDTVIRMSCKGMSKRVGSKADEVRIWGKEDNKNVKRKRMWKRDILWRKEDKGLGWRKKG